MLDRASMRIACRGVSLLIPKLPKDHFFLGIYSCLRASIGSKRAARRAGK